MVSKVTRKRTPGRRSMKNALSGAFNRRATRAGNGVEGAGLPKKGALTPNASRRSANRASEPPLRTWRRACAPAMGLFSSSPPGY